MGAIKPHCPGNDKAGSLRLSRVFDLSGFVARNLFDTTAIAKVRGREVYYMRRD